MAFNLYSPPSPSSLLHIRHSIRPSFLSPQHKTSIQTTNVSLQSPISPENAIQSNPNEKPASSPKFSAWINPRSKRTSNPKNSPKDSRYNSLVKLSNSLNSCNPIQDEVFRVLSDFPRRFSEQDAVIVLNNMSNPDTALLALKYFQKELKYVRDVVLYNVTMKVLKKSKDFGNAQNLFDEMLERKIKPDNLTFLALIGCAKSCSKPEKAIELFEKMPSFECEPNAVTFISMIDPYVCIGNVAAALCLYGRVRKGELRIDAGTYATLIKMYGKAGDFDGCLNLYNEMKVVGVKPSGFVYCTLLDAMGRANRPKQARKIHTDMMNDGLVPNWGTYASLLRAYGGARYVEDAVRVYKEMKKNGMELNVGLYNVIFAACADVGYFEEASEVYREMKESGGCSPDKWTFSSLITVYCCCGKVSEAEGILGDMVEAGFQPNIFVFTSLVQCYGKVQQTDKVVDTFSQMLNLGIVPDDRFCACLLNVMAQTPNEELGKLIVCVEKANPNLGQFVRRLVENRDGSSVKEEASELLHPLRSDVKKSNCNYLIDLCLNLEMLEQARELFQLGVSLDIYSNIQSRTPTQWSLHLKGLSRGAALTAFNAWINDLSNAVESGEELPPLLGIRTGRGKHRYYDQSLAAVFEKHLKELNAPFTDDLEKVGWFFATDTAAKLWLEESKTTPDSAST